jgi:hypothetical protein
MGQQEGAPMKTGFTCPIHDQYVPEGACPWCEPLPAPPAKELESTDALEALRLLFWASNITTTTASVAGPLITKVTV